jgi:hypothetical protein
MAGPFGSGELTGQQFICLEKRNNIMVYLFSHVDVDLLSSEENFQKINR